MPKRQVKALTLRLDSRLVQRIDRLNQQRHEALVKAGYAGFGYYNPERGPVLSRAQMIRWALEEGLAAIEAKLKKAGAR